MTGVLRPQKVHPSHLLAVAFAAGLLLTACGPSSSGPPTTGASTSSSTTASTTTAAAGCVADPAAVAGRAATTASTTAALPADLVTTLDAAAQASFKEAAAPGAIVGVRTPQGSWTAAYGVADPATGTPMATDLHMRIGSVTKTFTGTLILQLAQDGKLSLDDTIDKYYPGIPNGSTVTLRMLANMTSGISSYFTPDFLPIYFEHPATIFTPEQLIAYGVAASPIFAPGEKFNYSNTNTILLGKVVEKVTGQPFGTVLQQKILDPLGLTGTSWPGDSSDIPNPHPQGFTLQGSGTPENPANATNWSPSFGWSAGAMISTVDDLLVYDRALGTGQGLLSQAAQIERLKSFPGPTGYGLAVGCIDGWMGHTGELPGFNTSLFYDTTSDTSVVVLVNSDISSGGCSESPTLTDNPADLPCSSPATRVFVGLSTALGHTFAPNPAK
ncbi:serine hydrolase domain-containing protein [Arthrobacter sp. 35W]|uniref:serine hydrolase domain-containing protein n=1 Tax=Arthrobacter sp. 35W TaxID=1132441 RepID=UPI0004002E2F|nr:serine hydrolase domain-containing protein [Arthrobacter sp. 35W]